MDLYVWNETLSETVPVNVVPATLEDLRNTADWQTQWTTKAAKSLFAYAIQISKDCGFDGVLYFRAKTSELREYYGRAFGAVPLGQYDPFRMIIWEDAAKKILANYGNEVD